MCRLKLFNSPMGGEVVGEQTMRRKGMREEVKGQVVGRQLRTGSGEVVKREQVGGNQVVCPCCLSHIVLGPLPLFPHPPLSSPSAVSSMPCSCLILLHTGCNRGSQSEAEAAWGQAVTVGPAVPCS